MVRLPSLLLASVVLTLAACSGDAPSGHVVTDEEAAAAGSSADSMTIVDDGVVELNSPDEQVPRIDAAQPIAEQRDQQPIEPTLQPDPTDGVTVAMAAKPALPDGIENVPTDDPPMAAGDLIAKANLQPELQPGMETRTFETVGPDGAIRLSFDDIDLLKVLGLDKEVPVGVAEAFPAWLAELDGRRVRLKGFMYPPSEPSGIKGFLFARDNEICCFGRDPLAYDIMPVRMRTGETTHYIQMRPFDVVGTFHIDPIESDFEEGMLEWVYAIDDAIVIE